MRYDPAQSIFAGMPRVQLEADLAAAQRAYGRLSNGEKVVTAAYGQGDGTKSVTYTAASLPNLVAYIKQLQAQLGIVRRARRPMRFWYR